MLPKDLRKTVALQQSPKTLRRGKKEKKPPVYGKCSLCKRDEVLLFKVKHSMCKMCYAWCHKFLMQSKGFYNETFIHEAIIAFRKPVLCRFHSICGGLLPRLDGNRRIHPNRSAICPRCAPIYQQGVHDGRTKPKRRLGNRIGHE